MILLNFISFLQSSVYDDFFNFNYFHELFM
jgi:hypothetical protein